MMMACRRDVLRGVEITAGKKICWGVSVTSVFVQSLFSLSCNECVSILLFYNHFGLSVATVLLRGTPNYKLTLQQRLFDSGSTTIIQPWHGGDGDGNNKVTTHLQPLSSLSSLILNVCATNNTGGGSSKQYLYVILSQLPPHQLQLRIDRLFPPPLILLILFIQRLETNEYSATIPRSGSQNVRVPFTWQTSIHSDDPLPTY